MKLIKLHDLSTKPQRYHNLKPKFIMYLFGVSKRGERFQSLGYEIKQGGDQ
jgi:hypothetical protein